MKKGNLIILLFVLVITSISALSRELGDGKAEENQSHHRNRTTHLFFSEYIEGSSSNKALEIFNGTGGSVDLAPYVVKMGSNGGLWNNEINLEGTLANGDVFVIANSGATQSILEITDATGTVTYFNGDDTIGLFVNDVLTDVIGLYQLDPGIAWDVAGISNATLNHTLVRKDDVAEGTTDWAISAGTNVDNSQWIVYESDDFSHLGYHDSYASFFEYIYPVSNATNISLTPTISLEVIEEFISYQLYFGDTPNPETEIVSFSDITNPISYTFTEPLEYLTDYYWTLILYDANYSPTTLNFTFKTRPTFEGLGTEENPYQIATINDLIAISENSEFWDKYLIQTANIDASSTSELNDGAGFSPIGNNDISFTGSYDGQNKAISNLFINRPSTNFIGLFGYTYQAYITNLRLVDNEINGYYYVGGLVGYANFSTISNSYAIGDVSGDSHVGGLVGYADSSTISNSYASGDVSGGYYYTGGLIGRASSSTISNSYASGDVNGDYRIGGLVGYADSSTISNSYASGAVSGYSNLGGLVGYGNVTATNSFWDIETSGQTTSIGGTGKTSQAMTSLYTYLNAGWDFLGEELNGSQDIWHIHPSVNSGYPYLVSDQEDVANYLPAYAVASYPNDGVSNLATSDNLIWQADFLELTSGYRLNLGTNNPPTSLVNNQDLGLTTFYDYNNLEANTTYYWQVIPYNANGDAEDCSIWSFTTGTTGLVSVGSGDNTNQALPINQQIQKSYNQSIYLQSELNLANRDIESLAFYLTGDLITAGANQWKVYLGHTTKTEFATANDWLLANQGLTEVANITLPENLSAGWLEFQLTAPFAYNNVDNLIVGVVEYSSGIAENPANFYTVETNSNRSLTFGHDTTIPNPSIPYAGTISTSIPKINFTFSESTTRFTGLVQNSQNQALANASVYIAEFGTFPTNALGEFNIHNVEAGTYQLSISAPWYETQSAEFEVLEGQDNYLEITLLEELLPANNLLATLAEDLSNVNITWSAPALSRVASTSKQTIGKATKEIKRTGQPAVSYNLYRYELADVDNQANWLELATNLNVLTYTDNSFPTLELGSYYWAVKVVYVNDRISLPAISNEIAKQPFLDSSLAELDFGIVYLTNESEYSEIILINTGTGDLTISNISCDESAFNLVYDEGAFVLTPNATFTIEVNFEPSSPITYLAQLLINNNSSNEANFGITLRGVCEYLPPVNPEGVQVTMLNNTAQITWEEVTEDIDGNPITPDRYVVYYNGLNTNDDNHFYYLANTTELSYSHDDVGLFSAYHFYRVKAYINVNNYVFTRIDELLAQKGKVSLEEIEKMIEGSKLQGFKTK